MAIITRRRRLGGMALLLGGAGVPPGGQLAFRALRNGSEIGRHVLTFTGQADALQVSIAVDYVVKFGPIPVYRYKLRGQERWRGDVLEESSAETDDDGTAAFMRARREGETMAVEGSKSGRYFAPPGAIAATHWNRRELDAPMINPQDGELMRFTVAPGAIEAVKRADDSAIQARRYALTGHTTMDLWYDEAGQWSALRAVVRDGSIISYLRE